MITHLFAPTRKRAENNAQHARTYLYGLLSETERKNSEAIAGAAGSNIQSQDLQNFIADSQWSEDGVFAHVATHANRRLGNHPDSMLAVDESSFSKKGDHSAGVGRQYSGRQGKIDNCQVGVFTSLCNGPNAMLVGARLLLPDEWAKDPKRCRAAGIPDDRIKAASKTDLARELIVQADDHGIQYARMGMVALAGLFVAEERLFQKESSPLLSTRDVVQLLDWHFRNTPTLESVIEQIEKRHRRRRVASKSKNKTAA